MAQRSKVARAPSGKQLSGTARVKALFFFVHQKEYFSVRDFPPEKRRLRIDSVVLLPHTKASTFLTPQMPDACERLYFSVKISPPSSSFFMERPTRVILPVFSPLIADYTFHPSTHALPRRPLALGPFLSLIPNPYSLVPFPHSFHIFVWKTTLFEMWKTVLPFFR